jgi:hypothetical protein
VKYIHLFLISLLFSIVTGCYHPITTIFDSARSLKQDETNVTLAGSADLVSSPSGNMTAIVDKGLTSNIDLRFRFDKRFVKKTSLDLGNFGSIDLESPYYFVELAPKFSKNNKFAFSIPLQAYFLESGFQVYSLDPRFIFSLKSKNNLSEFNLILRTQIGILEGEFGGFIPGACFGVRLGNDLDKRGLRFEVGLMPHSITFGLGYQTRLGSKD